jgi:TusA-related sulfurtransferase
LPDALRSGIKNVVGSVGTDMTATNNDEERIMARGLKSPGPLLMVKKRLKTLDAVRIRVIVSSREAAEDIVNFFESRGAASEIDRAGEDFHVVVDMRTFRDVD